MARSPIPYCPLFLCAHSVCAQCRAGSRRYIRWAITFTLCSDVIRPPPIEQARRAPSGADMFVPICRCEIVVASAPVARNRGNTTILATSRCHDASLRLMTMPCEFARGCDKTSRLHLHLRWFQKTRINFSLWYYFETNDLCCVGTMIFFRMSLAVLDKFAEQTKVKLKVIKKKLETFSKYQSIVIL